MSLPRELAFAHAFESNLREDTVQVRRLHPGSETLTQRFADRMLASLPPR